MSLPAAWTKVTVTGTFYNLDGTPASGAIRFFSSQVVVIDGIVVVPTELVAPLDSTGSFSIQLPSTDDPSLNVTGWAYRVVEDYERGRSYNIFVEYNGGAIDLATVAPVVDPPDLVTTRGPAGADGVVQAVVAGGGISVDNTDPANPIVSATGDADITNDAVNAAIEDNPPATRTSLGLGTAALQASTAFATAAQGSKADTAVQPGALATVATSGAYSDLTGRPSLGTAAASDTSDFDASGAAAAAQAAAATDATTKATAAETAAKDYADTLVVGLVDDRGNYDASVNLFPSTGGSGAAGAVLKGDLWTVNVAGALGGAAVTAGDLVRALVDAPGQTAGNWAVTENNIGYVPEPAQTAVSQAEAEAGTSTSTRSWTPLRVFQAVAAKLALGTWISGATGKTTPVDADTFAMSDSAASNALKKLTWANLKATLKTYTDTLYAVRAPSIQSVTSSATVTPTFADDLVKITAQAAGLTLANPTGTAIPGLGIVIRIKDDGTARAISYGTQYRAIGVTLPTTTVSGKTTYLAMIYNSDDTKWDVVAVGTQA